jgi:hypothetical protein
MDARIKHRFDRLKYLGYSTFHIRRMINEAIGTEHIMNASSAKLKVLAVLEKYEKLGSTYINKYSK